MPEGVTCYEQDESLCTDQKCLRGCRIRKEKEPYNEGYTHEAMHTAHVLLDTWDNHVIDTRACDEFPEIKEAAEKALTAMYDVYQLLGQKFT